MGKTIKSDEQQIKAEASAAKNALNKDLKNEVKEFKPSKTKPKNVQEVSEARKFARKIGLTWSHVKYGLSLLAILFIGVIGGYIVSANQNDNTTTNNVIADDSALVYLQPSNQNLDKNQTFTVKVKGNSHKVSVNAVQATISYPADLVEVVSVDTTNSAYKIDVLNNSKDGKIEIARGQVNGLTGDNLIASVTFKTKADPGKAEIIFINDTALIDSTNHNNLVKSLSSNTKGATVNIQ